MTTDNTTPISSSAAEILDEGRWRTPRAHRRRIASLAAIPLALGGIGAAQSATVSAQKGPDTFCGPINPGSCAGGSGASGGTTDGDVRNFARVAYDNGLDMHRGVKYGDASHAMQDIRQPGTGNQVTTSAARMISPPREALLSGASVAAVVVHLTSGIARAHAAVSGTWNRLAACESSGHWNASTGNGFSGGLQFTASTWKAFGGGRFAANARQANKTQQIAVAERVLRAQGPGAWPVCSKKAGIHRP